MQHIVKRLASLFGRLPLLLTVVLITSDKRCQSRPGPDLRPAGVEPCQEDHDHGVHILVPQALYGPPLLQPLPALQPLPVAAPPQPSISYGPPAPIAPVVSSQKYTGPKVTKEETEKLHAQAIAQLQELSAQQDAINAAGPAQGGGDSAGSDGDSNDGEDCDKSEVSAGVQVSGGTGAGEQLILVPIGIAQLQPPFPVHTQVSVSSSSSSSQSVVSSSSSSSSQSAVSSSSKYTGRQVTKEETERLQADAIAKLNELIAMQQQMAAAGPALAGSNDEDEAQGGPVTGTNAITQGASAAGGAGGNVYVGPFVTKEETECLHAESISKLKELIAFQQQQMAAVSSSSAVGASAQQTAVVSTGGNKYTGPFVTKEETERLHAVAIAKLEELVALQNKINAAGPATGGASEESQESEEDLSQNSVVETHAGTYTGPKVTKEETEKLHAEAIAKLNELISLQRQINAAGPAPADPNYVEPAQHQVASSGGAVWQVVQQQQQQLPANPPPYTGPFVTAEETAQLHALALAEQQKLIAVQNSIAAVAQQQVVQQQHGHYTGPQVTAEETAQLHAQALATHAQLVAQQDAINAAGPAKPSAGSASVAPAVQQAAVIGLKPDCEEDKQQVAQHQVQIVQGGHAGGSVDATKVWGAWAAPAPGVGSGGGWSFWQTQDAPAGVKIFVRP